MTLELTDQPALRAVQSILRALIGSPEDTSRPGQRTRLEVLWRDMTAAGDLLADVLRLEQKFNKIDLTQTDADVLDRWRLHRQTVERMAEDYVSAVSNWREALQVECQALESNRISNCATSRNCQHDPRGSPQSGHRGSPKIRPTKLRMPGLNPRSTRNYRAPAAWTRNANIHQGNREGIGC
jgi:hypothetical protein